MTDLDDFPTVGLAPFDLWMSQLSIYMIISKFIDIQEFGSLDREHWKQYHDNGYTVREAFEEDLTAYGD